MILVLIRDNVLTIVYQWGYQFAPTKMLLGKEEYVFDRMAPTNFRLKKIGFYNFLREQTDEI